MGEEFLELLVFHLDFQKLVGSRKTTVSKASEITERKLDSVLHCKVVDVVLCLCTEVL